jgi:hypothetical protein
MELMVRTALSHHLLQQLAAAVAAAVHLPVVRSLEIQAALAAVERLGIMLEAVLVDLQLQVKVHLVQQLQDKVDSAPAAAAVVLE